MNPQSLIDSNKIDTQLIGSASTLRSSFEEFERAAGTKIILSCRTSSKSKDFNASKPTTSYSDVMTRSKAILNVANITTLLYIATAMGV